MISGMGHRAISIDLCDLSLIMNLPADRAPGARFFVLQSRFRRPGGTADPREMDIVGLTFKELTIKGVRVYEPYDFERAIELIVRTKWNLGLLLSAPYSMEEANEAFSKAAEGKDTMRVVFRISDRPNASSENLPQS